MSSHTQNALAMNRCANAHDPQYLAQVFDLAEKTVASCTDWTPDRERERRSYRETLDFFARETDDGFFRQHVAIVFFSGFKASIVEAKLPAIYNAFPDIDTVLAYDSDQIEALMDNPNLIRNRAKITAVTGNARSFQTIINQYGSFSAYLLSFNEGFPEGVGDPAEILDDLDRLQADLMNRLAYFGPATTKHFLMDYGLNFIKPDVHVMRVLHRLGLVKTAGGESYGDAIRMGRLISDAADVPIRYVDTVLVSLGMTSEANLCRKTDPLCGDCLLKSRCAYYHSL